VVGHQDVRGFDVAMDNAFLVGVLDRLADFYEQVDRCCIERLFWSQ